MVDIESHEKVVDQQVIKDLEYFTKQVNAATGCKPIIYTSPVFWDGLNAHEFGQYLLWLADYAKTPTLPNGWNGWLFWQYESDGAVAGIDGQVDKSLFSGTISELNNLACFTLYH